VAVEIYVEALKKFAKRELKSYPITGKFILEEPEKMSKEEFILKVKIWLQMLEKEMEIEESR